MGPGGLGGLIWWLRKKFLRPFSRRQEAPLRLPTHLAIIMDGNGRWAQLRGLPRILGHRAGVESVRAVARRCGELGIRFLTLYTFSRENWQRSPQEVAELMGMLERLVEEEVPELMRNRVRLRAIGRLSDLPEGVRSRLEAAIQRTAGNTGLVLTLALSYGGRDEILDAVEKLRSTQGEVTAERFRQSLYDPELPDPDLLIRTGGERRLSNFLLWQLAYTELYFTDTLWPDFRERELELTLRDYSKRERRFGRV